MPPKFVMDKLRDLYSVFCQEKKDSATKIMGILVGVSFGLFALFMIFPSFFRAPFIFVQLVLISIQTILYTSFVPCFDNPSKPKTFCKRMLQISMVIFIVFVLTVPLRTLQAKTHSAAIADVCVMAFALTLALSTVSVFF